MTTWWNRLRRSKAWRALLLGGALLLALLAGALAVIKALSPVRIIKREKLVPVPKPEGDHVERYERKKARIIVEESDGSPAPGVRDPDELCDEIDRYEADRLRRR